MLLVHVFLLDNLSDKMPSTNEETDFVEDIQMVVEVDFHIINRY